jgi:hypothetical protein
VSIPGGDMISRLATVGQAGSEIPLAFSENGETLAVIDDDEREMQLWNMTNARHPEQAGPPLIIPGTGSGDYVALSPDASPVATVPPDDGPPARLWDLNLTRAASDICARTPPPTHAQWLEDVPGLRYAPPCTPPHAR